MIFVYLRVDPCSSVASFPAASQAPRAEAIITSSAMPQTDEQMTARSEIISDYLHAEIARGRGLAGFVGETNAEAPFAIGRQTIALLFGEQALLALGAGEPFTKCHGVVPAHVHDRLVGPLLESRLAPRHRFCWTAVRGLQHRSRSQPTVASTLG